MGGRNPTTKPAEEPAHFDYPPDAFSHGRPAWREDVHEAVRALLAGRAAGVQARLYPRRRQTVTVGQIEQAVAGALAGADPRAAAAIVHHDVAASGAVVADVAVAVPGGQRRLRIAVLPTGELGGLTILPQDRAGS